MRPILFCFFAVSALAQSEPHDQWKKLFNTNIDSIHKAYTLDAVQVTLDGKVISTAKERASFYAELKKEIKQIKSVTTIRKENVTPDLSFEIGYFKSNDEKKFMQMVIGRKTNNVLLREVEMLSEVTNEPIDLTGIKTARDIWMRLCNGHKASELLRNSYTSNAVYYNNHRVLIGNTSIAAEYRYMNNPNYQLTLTPIIVEAAGKDLAFEIGQCSGSYQGKYILVWKKIGDTWKVLFDSN